MQPKGLFDVRMRIAENWLVGVVYTERHQQAVTGLPQHFLICMLPVAISVKANPVFTPVEPHFPETSSERLN